MKDHHSPIDLLAKIEDRLISEEIRDISDSEFEVEVNYWRTSVTTLITATRDVDDNFYRKYSNLLDNMVAGYGTRLSNRESYKGQETIKERFYRRGSILSNIAEYLAGIQGVDGGFNYRV